MREPLPKFSTIAICTGYYPDDKRESPKLVAVSASRTKPGLYLAGWQLGASNAWMVPSYNALAFTNTEFGQISSIQVQRGGDHSLQVLGVNAEGRLTLFAQQDNGGAWKRPTLSDTPFPTASTFKSVSLVAGNGERLQAVGLRADERLVLAAWQDVTGEWRAGFDFRIQRQYASIVAVQGNASNVQVIGLTHDGRIFLAAWQQAKTEGKSPDGTWHYPDMELTNGPQRYRFISACKGPRDELQVVGIGSDGRLYLIARQTSAGHWANNWPNYRIGPDRRYSSVLLVAGKSGYLQALCIDADRRTPYLAGYADGNANWHTVDTPVLPSDRSYVELSAIKIHDGNLQVVGLGTDNRLYQIAWQDRDRGSWHPGRPLSPDADFGRWPSVVLENVPQAFSKVRNSEEVKLIWTGKFTLGEGHLQGMAQYKNYYIFTKNFFDEDNRKYGRIYIANRDTKKLVMELDTTEYSYAHPGGCQVIGDYLAVELEHTGKKDHPNDGDKAIVRFYWLGCLTDSNGPALLPPRLVLDGSEHLGAGAVGITDIPVENSRGYALALKTREGASYFKGNQCLLDDPSLLFEKQPVLASSLKHGADNLCFLTDGSNRTYLIAMTSSELGPIPTNNYATLYEVDMDRQRQIEVNDRTFHSSGMPKEILGPFFRYGAGGVPVDSTKLKLYCCGWDPTLYFSINEYQ
ncbi:hypothetical protein [Paraburkholderia caledonica]|uniref:Exo-alpha-sialidase n=1 Tax=Paraburkholderia caledonica TaxID=134536 RepID=A0AB73IPP3_9BURK|nr:hypothetical protein [Paraburkholderia caledonica]